MFRESSDGIEEYITSVTGFISKCIEEIIPTVTIVYHKPWITGNIRTELKGRAAAFGTLTRKLTRNPSMPCDEPSKQAKRQYRAKIESYYTSSDARLMWQGLQTITDYKGKHSHKLPSDTSLPDVFYLKSVVMKCFEKVVNGSHQHHYPRNPRPT
jgi:hypothetical protein